MTPRQEVWLRAWTAVAGCWNQKQLGPCAKWADECLNEFDKRFPNADQPKDPDSALTKCAESP